MKQGNQNLTLFFSALLLCSGIAQAEFVLDFTPKGEDGGRGFIDAEGTQFLTGSNKGEYNNANSHPWIGPEVVFDPSTNKHYYHVIVGSLADGFIQETYIEATSAGFYWNDGFRSSASPGAMNNAAPLSSTTAGNADANPTKVIFRQIMTSEGMYTDVTKDQYDKKPVITQIQTTPKLFSYFQVDMRNSNYNDDTTTGLVTYFTSFADDYEDAASFNFATDTQDSILDAGLYTYTDGGENLGSDGTYNYATGGWFDRANVSWESYFDHTISNPWTVESNKPTP